MSGTELRVWIRLRGRKLDGWKFRRQQPIGPYYVDFYCPAAKLVIEIDGPSHSDEGAAYDVRRQAWLEAEGYKVVRFPVYDIDDEVEGVIDSIRYELEEREKVGFGRRPSRSTSPSGLSGHLPMNGEDPLPTSPSGLSGHLPMNGEDPLPTSPSGLLGHLPINGEDQSLTVSGPA